MSKMRKKASSTTTNEKLPKKLAEFLEREHNKEEKNNTSDKRSAAGGRSRSRQQIFSCSALLPCLYGISLRYFLLRFTRLKITIMRTIAASTTIYGVMWRKVSAPPGREAKLLPIKPIPVNTAAMAAVIRRIRFTAPTPFLPPHAGMPHRLPLSCARLHCIKDITINILQERCQVNRVSAVLSRLSFNALWPVNALWIPTAAPSCCAVR